MFILTRNDPVQVAQRLIADGRSHGSTLGKALRRIVSDQLWQDRQDAEGRPFLSFAQFATAAQPNGLGIRTQEAMDDLGLGLDKGFTKCGQSCCWRRRVGGDAPEKTSLTARITCRLSSCPLHTPPEPVRWCCWRGTIRHSLRN
jgi:hypothetical protein